MDSSAAELGAWEDWGCVCFDGMYASLYDMRAGMKDYSLYDVETGMHYTSNGDLKGGDRDISELEIIHEDWMFLRELDGFIPNVYNIKIKTEDGVFDAKFKVANAVPWGVTYTVPDNPVITLIYDGVEGSFTYNDGRDKKLSGGYGYMSVRQWHQYPNILPRELYAETEHEASQSKFDTL